jgi:hypothetical protein
MAGQTTVGNLAVDMTLNSAAFQADFSRLTKSMEVNSKAIEKGLGGIATGMKVLGGTLASVSFAALIQGSLRATEQLKVQADQLGASTTELQEFRYAGQQVGLAAGDMDKALQKLNIQIGLAAAGADKQKGLFDALGISVTGADGKARAAYDVFADLAGAIGKIENPATRAATLAALLGEELGPKLAPLLAKGADGMRTLRDDAHRLGIVLSEDAIAKSSEAAREIETLKSVLAVNISNAVADNAAGIAKLAESITDLSVAAIKLAATDIDRTEEVVAALAGAAVGSRFGLFGAGAGALIGGVGAKAANFSDASSYIYQKAGGGVAGILAQQKAALPWNRNLLEAAKLEMGLIGNYDIFKGTGLSRSSSSGSTSGVDMTALAKLLAAAKAKRPAKSPREKAADTLDFPTPEEMTRAIDELRRDAERRLKDATDLIADSVKREGGDIGKAIIGEDGLIGDDRWAKMEADAQRYVELTERAERFATQFASSLDSAFEDAIFSGKGLKDILAGLAQDLARLIIRLTVIEPLARQIGGLIAGSGSGGGILSGLGSLFGASATPEARAAGGPVSAGSLYMVGERGRELFVPRTPGMILPADVTDGLMGGGGQRVDVHVTASPELIVTSIVAGQQAGAAAAGGVVRRATRGQLMRSRG